ncbi:MAG TPA: hypothetical protein VN325_13250, partial [Steroidobacteraceae bacterium]|nr:hypothetical protein [Steroidobacteraceae bacterium]
EVTMTATEDAYRFEFAWIEGDRLPFDAWRGRPVLVVNTAAGSSAAHECSDRQHLAFAADLDLALRKRGKVEPGARHGLLGHNELAGKVLGQAFEPARSIDIRVAPDSPLEGAVTSEPVSEAKFPASRENE